MGPQRPLVRRRSSEFKRQQVGHKSDTHNAPVIELGYLDMVIVLVGVYLILTSKLRSLAGNKLTKQLLLISAEKIIQLMSKKRGLSHQRPGIIVWIRFEFKSVSVFSFADLCLRGGCRRSVTQSSLRGPAVRASIQPLTVGKWEPWFCPTRLANIYQQLRISHPASWKFLLNIIQSGRQNSKPWTRISFSSLHQQCCST